MPDISMCQNQACPSNQKCYRFMALPDKYQAYSIFEVTGKRKRCDSWLPLRPAQVFEASPTDQINPGLINGRPLEAQMPTSVPATRSERIHRVLKASVSPASIQASWWNGHSKGKTEGIVEGLEMAIRQIQICTKAGATASGVCIDYLTALIEEVKRGQN